MTRLTEGFSHFVTSMTAPLLPAGAIAGWDSHPLESAAFSRRTPKADLTGSDDRRSAGSTRTASQMALQTPISAELGIEFSVSHCPKYFLHRSVNPQAPGSTPGLRSKIHEGLFRSHRYRVTPDTWVTLLGSDGLSIGSSRHLSSSKDSGRSLVQLRFRSHRSVT